MKRLTLIFVGLAVLAAGFQSMAAEPAKPGAASPKRRLKVAVVGFKNASGARAPAGIGDNLAEYLEEKLKNNPEQRFDVVSRETGVFQQAMKEFEMSETGITDRDSAVKMGKVVAAKYLIMGTLTQWDQQTIGGGASIPIPIPGPGHFRGVFPSDLNLGLKFFVIELRVKLVETETGRVLFSRTYADKSKGKIDIAAFSGPVRGKYEGWSRTHVGKTANVVLDRIIADIANPPASPTKACVKCEKQIPVDDRNCKYCDEPQQPVSRACPKCKTEIEDPEANYCPKCRAKLPPLADLKSTKPEPVEREVEPQTRPNSKPGTEPKSVSDTDATTESEAETHTETTPTDQASLLRPISSVVNVEPTTSTSATLTTGAVQPSSATVVPAVLPAEPGTTATAAVAASTPVLPPKPPTVEPLLRYGVDTLAQTVRIAKNGRGKADIAFRLLIKSGLYDRPIQFPDLGAVSLARLETTTGTLKLEHKTSATKEDRTVHSFRSPLGHIPSGAVFHVVFDGDLEKLELVVNPGGEGEKPIEVQWQPMLCFHDAVISTYSLRLIYPLDYTGPESRKAPKAFVFEPTLDGPAPSRQLFGSVDGKLAVTFMWPNLTSSQSLALTVATKVREMAPAPTAAFEATPARGEAPLTVQFRNLSKGPIARHVWDFGDQAQSTETEPTHRYAVPGSFTVTLKVSGPGGTDTKRAPDAIGVLMKERTRLANEILAVLGPGAEKTVWKQLVEGTSAEKLRCAQNLVARARRRDKDFLDLFLPLIVYDLEHNEDKDFKDLGYQQYRALLVDTLAYHDKEKAGEVLGALDKQAPQKPDRWDLATDGARRWLRSRKSEETK